MSIEYKDADGDTMRLLTTWVRRDEDGDEHNIAQGPATPDDLIAALQQNDALRAEVLRGLYEVHGMATDHAREVGKCIGCHKDKRLTRIVPGAGKLGLCMDCAHVIRLYGRDTDGE